MSDVSKYLPKLLGPHSVTQDGGDEVIARPTWDFVGFTITDDAANDKTVFGLPAGAFVAPTGTGFVSVTSGVLDAASIKVNLASGTYVTGTLAVGNGGTGITSLGTGVATFWGAPSSANLAAAVTDETGTGGLVFANTPTLVTPVLGAATGTSLVASGSVAAATLAASSAITAGASPSSTGLIRMANASSIRIRNAAGNADYGLIGIASSNNMVVGCSEVQTLGVENIAIFSKVGGATWIGTTSAILATFDSGASLITSAAAASITSNDTKGTARDVNPVHVQTTDATVTTLDSFTIASNSAVAVSWLVTAIKSDSSQMAAYSVSAGFKNNAGTVAQVGTTAVTIISESDAAWDATSDNSTTTIRLRITGKASTTIQWTAILTSLTVIP